MEVNNQKVISFGTLLSGMCKPLKFVYIANFSSREKLLKVLENYSLNPWSFEEQLTGLIMPVPETGDFAEFRFSGMFRNLIMLPYVESKLDLLAIKNLPRCFFNPNMQFREALGEFIEQHPDQLIRLRQFYQAGEDAAGQDFFGSRWMIDATFSDAAPLLQLEKQNLKVRKREFRLRLTAFMDKFRFEIREKEGDIWQSDPDLFLSSNESIVLMFLILASKNTGTPLAELMNFRSFSEVKNSYRKSWEQVSSLFIPFPNRRYILGAFEEESRHSHQMSVFNRVMRVIESTGFTAGRIKERVPLILDDSCTGNRHFSINNWNQVLGNIQEWVFPGKGIALPDTGKTSV